MTAGDGRVPGGEAEREALAWIRETPEVLDWLGAAGFSGKHIVTIVRAALARDERGINARVQELIDGLEPLAAKYPGHVRGLLGPELCDRLLAALDRDVPAPAASEPVVRAVREIMGNVSASWRSSPPLGPTRIEASTEETHVLWGQVADDVDAWTEQWVASVSDRAGTAPTDGPSLDLLESLVNADDCWFDHHGGCQAHGYLSLGPGEMCPQAELKQVIEAARSAS